MFEPGKIRALHHNKKNTSLRVRGRNCKCCRVLAVQRLTTNVTGHFACCWWNYILQKVLFIFYILSFFLGSFFFQVFIEITTLKWSVYFFIPIIIEFYFVFAVATRVFFVHYRSIIAFLSVICSRFTRIIGFTKFQMLL
jgi:hypothetical protein